MRQGMFLRAAERAVDTLLRIEGAIALEQPPRNALSEAQLADVYLDILATPVLKQAFIKAHGETVWAQYQHDMEQKLARLGAINVANAPGIGQDEVDEIHRIATQFMESREQPYGRTG